MKLGTVHFSHTFNSLLRLDARTSVGSKYHATLIPSGLKVGTGISDLTRPFDSPPRLRMRAHGTGPIDCRKC
jgi:hypothetical protein